MDHLRVCLFPYRRNILVLAYYVGMAANVVMGVLVAYLFSILTLPVFTDSAMATYAVFLVGIGAAYTWLCRSVHLTLEETRKWLADFSVSDAKCFDEADRPKVEQNIELCMKCCGYLDKQADREITTAAFNALVRNRVRETVERQLGTRPFTLKQLLVIVYLVNVAWCLDYGASYMVDHGIADSRWWTFSLHNVFSAGPLFILWSHVAEWMTGRFLSLRGVKALPWLFLTAVVLFSGINLHATVLKITLEEAWVDGSLESWSICFVSHLSSVMAGGAVGLSDRLHFNHCGSQSWLMRRT